MAHSGSELRECSQLATVAAAALRLGWSVGRLRYYEAQFRQELGCLRTPDDEPLFTGRQLQVLKNLHEWLQVQKTPEPLVRQRLKALGRWMREDLPLVSIADEPEVSPGTCSPPAVEGLPPPVEHAEALQGASARQGEVSDPVSRGELVLLAQQLQDLTERIRGMEETLSALLSYLQEARASEASNPVGTASTLPEPSTPTSPEVLPRGHAGGRLIKHADAEAWLAAGLISRWEAPEFDSKPPLGMGATPRSEGSQATKADRSWISPE